MCVYLEIAQRIALHWLKTSPSMIWIKSFRLRNLTNKYLNVPWRSNTVRQQIFSIREKKALSPLPFYRLFATRGCTEECKTQLLAMRNERHAVQIQSSRPISLISPDVCALVNCFSPHMIRKDARESHSTTSVTNIVFPELSPSISNFKREEPEIPEIVSAPCSTLVCHILDQINFVRMRDTYIMRFVFDRARPDSV